MLSIINKKSLYITFSLFLSAISTPCHANFSQEVVRAMDAAKDCNQASQNHIYLECMLINNQRLTKAILKISEQKIQKLPMKKQKAINDNINRKLKSIDRQCLNEQAMFGDSMNGERRHPYCLYENKLELLINVQQRSGIFAQ